LTKVDTLLSHVKRCTKNERASKDSTALASTDSEFGMKKIGNRKNNGRPTTRVTIFAVGIINYIQQTK